MFEAFVATFFEGLETFLVVAAALAFFRKSRRGVVSATQLGIAVSLGASVAAAWLLSNADNPDSFAWYLAVLSAVIVLLLGADVWSAARRMRAEREGRAQPDSQLPNGMAWLVVFLGTVVLLSRGGMLSVLLFGPLIFQVSAVEVTIAAASGTVAAALVSWSWSRYAHRLPSTTVVMMTGVVVAIFLSHVVISDILGLW